MLPLPVLGKICVMRVISENMLQSLYSQSETKVVEKLYHNSYYSSKGSFLR
jgi:hypothetical protein